MRGLTPSHPAVRAINGLIARKAREIRGTQWRITQTQARLAEIGDYGVNPTSYEVVPGLERSHCFNPVREWREMAEAFAALVSLDREIGELQRAKLACFRDVDFSGADYWLPLLLAGRDLGHPLDQDPEGLSALVAKNPLPVRVQMEGHAFVAALGSDPVWRTDALGLSDFVSALDDAPGLGARVAISSGYTAHATRLVPPEILILSGPKGIFLEAGPNLRAFRHALRLAIQAVAREQGLPEQDTAEEDADS